MDKGFSSYSSLFAYINQQLSDILQNEVTNFVKEEISESVTSNVHDKYEPRFYRRRLGRNAYGLSSINSMKHQMINSNTVEIWDDAQPSNRDFPYGSLAEAIEYGYGDQEWSRPRPFIAPLKEKLRTDGRLNKIIQAGLKARGIDVIL